MDEFLRARIKKQLNRMRDSSNELLREYLGDNLIDAELLVRAHSLRDYIGGELSITLAHDYTTKERIIYIRALREINAYVDNCLRAIDKEEAFLDLHQVDFLIDYWLNMLEDNDEVEEASQSFHEA